MRFGVASRPISGMSPNGDTYLIKKWSGQVLLAVIDGVGHGEEASIASEKARSYILKQYKKDVDQIILDLHANLHNTRGAAIGLLKIDEAAHKLFFCGIGNTEIQIVGEPPMHPASLDGIVGVNLRKALGFRYTYNSLRAAVLHSDGVSSKFSISSDYPAVYEQPQKVADQILAELGKQHDDSTIVIAVEDRHKLEP